MGLLLIFREAPESVPIFANRSGECNLPQRKQCSSCRSACINISLAY
uniref:Uncharacterized protein n=1 Tax=Arundo donax TaxID=35708 RepID=A0A0A9CR11_ARUDO